MNLDTFRDFCLSLRNTTFDFPFDSETLVFRIKGKIFALCGINASPLRVNLKCDPALARDLRASYPDIVPGWHMNKEHWNTVNLQGALPEEFLQKLIVQSYDLVYHTLPKRLKNF